MRAKSEIFDLLLNTAKEDGRIRAVLLSGSRANPAVPEDRYQDYDITFFVTCMENFFNKPEWVIEKFGKPLIMQMPEIMRYPDGGGHFNYMMIYPDGNRLDLTFDDKKYMDDGEPAVVLLDKDSPSEFFPVLPQQNDSVFHIKPPSPLDYYSACNEFWWCLNNVAKGIARDELPYVMYMLNEIVRPELHNMLEWYIGINSGFSFSAGKNGKYFKKYLAPQLYDEYLATYPSADYGEIWAAIFTMCALFRRLALPVAESCGFVYNQGEEDGMMTYLRGIKDGRL